MKQEDYPEKVLLPRTRLSIFPPDDDDCVPMAARNYDRLAPCIKDVEYTRSDLVPKWHSIQEIPEDDSFVYCYDGISIAMYIFISGYYKPYDRENVLDDDIIKWYYYKDFLNSAREFNIK